jgi:hypothetical protein
MPPVRFEPAIPASERPQTRALDPAATGIGNNFVTPRYLSWFSRPNATLKEAEYILKILKAQSLSDR